jgi:hypothetical protein
VAVSLVDPELDPDARIYCSAEANFRARDGGDVELTGLALTSSPGGVGLTPLTIFPGEFDFFTWSVNAHERELLERAQASYRRGLTTPSRSRSGIRRLPPRTIPGSSERATSCRMTSGRGCRVG